MNALVLDLLRTIKRLQPEQGNIARRNARRAVVSCLKKLRVKMEADYPVAKRKPKERASPKTWGQRMRRRGWELLEGSNCEATVTQIAALIGVKLRKEPGGDIWAPGWLISSWENQSTASLKRMATDHNYRKVVLVERVLKTDKDA